MWRRRIVPKNLHLKNMNPNIDLTDFPVIMPSSIIDWKAWAKLVSVTGVNVGTHDLLHSWAAPFCMSAEQVFMQLVDDRG